MSLQCSAPRQPTCQQVDIFLRPGEYFVGDASHRIRTVLGSCVSMTLWCPHQRVGAMSHFLLPTRGGAGRVEFDLRGPDVKALDARFGDEALVLLMMRAMSRMKVKATHCQAKIFGGGDMFPGQKTRGSVTVGQRNGEMARELLQVRGIEVISECLFGEGHRQIAFDVGTGHVWSRQVRPNSEIVRPAQESAAP